MVVHTDHSNDGVNKNHRKYMVKRAYKYFKAQFIDPKGMLLRYLEGDEK